MQIDNNQIYSQINIENDTLKESYILGAELSGRYGFPQLHPIHADLGRLSSVPFNKAKSEKNPRQSFVHFFVNDYEFERIWNNCDQHIDYLQNFKYVCSPDFSMYSDMPLALQIYNTYRNRAVARYLWANGIDVIPTVGWSDESSFEWCFDGLPQNSTLAVSTNGCFFPEGKECYQKGFEEMCRRLNPYNVIVIGSEIPVDVEVDTIYFKSHGQEMAERISYGRKKWQKEKSDLSNGGGSIYDC